MQAFWTNGADLRMLVDGFENDPTLLASAQQKANTLGLLGRNLYLRSGALSTISYSMPYADNLLDLVAATGLNDADLSNVSYNEIERVLATGAKAWVGGLTSTAALNSWISGTHPLSTGTVFTDTFGTWAVITKISRLPNTYEGGGSITNAGNRFYNDYMATWPTLPQWAAKPYGGCMPNGGGKAFKWGYLAKICVGGGRMYGFDGNTLCGLRAQSGQLLWQKTGLSMYSVGGIQPFSKGVVYDNQIIDGETGLTTGTIPLPSGWTGSRSYQVDSDILYAVGRDSSGINTLFAYDLVNQVSLYSQANFIDNKTVSTYYTGGLMGYLPSVVMAGGKIYANSGVSVYCYNASDGSKNWGPVTAPGSIHSIEASPNGALLQSGSNLYFLRVVDGGLKWGPVSVTSGYYDIAKISSLNNGNEAICSIGNSYAVDLLTGSVCSDRLGNYGPGSCSPGASMMPAGFFSRRSGMEFSMVNKDTSINSSDPYASDCTDAPFAASGMIIHKDKWYNCTCYGLFRGSNAQSPMATTTGTFNPEQPAIQSDRLQQGPAYGSNLNVQVVPNSLDWATHRANLNRSGYLPVPVVTSSCVQLWKYTNPTPNSFDKNKNDDFYTYHDVTPPVTAGAYSATSAGYTYLAGSDGVVKCLDNATGTLVWSYPTGAWVFATPTVANGCVYVGSGDGYAYCLEAHTGRLVWKFRAAPSERRFNYYGHLISTWPILTGILVHPNGNAYFASGMMDEYGVQVFALSASTGAMVWQDTNAGICLDNRPGLARAGHMPGGYMTVQGPNLLIKEGTHAYGKGLQRIDVYDLLTGAISTQDTSFPKLNQNGTGFWTGRQIGLMGNYVVGWGEDIHTEMEYEQSGGCTTFSKFNASGNPVRPFLQWGAGIARNNLNLNTIVWDGVEAYLDATKTGATVWDINKYELSGSAGLTQYLDNAVANPIVSCTTAYNITSLPLITPSLTPYWHPVSLGGTNRAMALTTNCLVEVNSTGGIGVMDRVTGSQLFQLSSGGEPYLQGLAVDRSGKIIVVNRNGDVVCYGTPSPVIVTAPMTITGAVSGQPQTFSVEAAGSGLSYQWRFNGTAISGGTNATYTIPSVTSASAGDYDVVVTNANGSTTSAAASLSLTVTATITAPVTGTILAEPANIALSASASSLAGSISKVDYYQGSTWLGTSSTYPYNFTWTNVPAGSYSLTAVATDTQGGTGSSRAVNIAVAGLQVHLPFDESAGSTAFDTSGHGNNGTLVNSPTWFAQSIFNGGLHFTAPGSSRTAVTLPTLTALSNSSFTVGFWVNSDAMGYAQTVLTCKDTVSNKHAYLIAEGYGGASNLPSNPLILWPTTSGTTVTSTQYPAPYTPYQLNKWYHFAIVATPSEVDWYVNGSLFTVLIPPNGSQMITSYKDFIIGNNTASNGSFLGSIDELKIYDHALGASDIWAMANTNIPYRSLPQISLLSPSNGTVITSTNSVTMSVAFSGSHYPLKVIYCQNGTPLLTSTVTSYTFTNLVRGTYNLTAQVVDGLNQAVTSSTATVTFSPVAAPTVNLASGMYKTAQNITINDIDSAAVIHYTTNGMDPTENDPVIASGGSLAINQTVTLKLRAFEPGVYPSEIQTVLYRIGWALAGGANHSVALTSNGPLWAWGYNSLGGLGDGTTTQRSLPVITSGLTNVLSIAAGGYHNLALKPDGTVWTWGYNVYGQLGINNNTTTVINTPVQVLGTGGNGFLSNIEAIAAGSYHSLALKPDGTVWTWGYNSDGELGDGTTTLRTTPVQVLGTGSNGFLSNVGVIAAGNYYSLALKNDGTVWTWGSNNNGQLGDGTTTQRTTPVQVTGLSGTVVAIAAGSGHSLALKNDGTVWAWGANYYGELGDGTTTQRTTPVQVTGLSGTVVAIAAGSNHSLALKSDGTVWAWGWNYYGQLGDGTTTQQTTPIQATVSGTVTTIAAGNCHNLVLTSNNSLWTWGYNGYGQLGNGTTTNTNVPINITVNGPCVSFAAAAETVLETSGPVTITAYLSTPSTQTVTIPFTTGSAPNGGATAKSGTDYTLSPSSPLTIPAGQISAAIVVNPINSSIYKSTRSFVLNLGTPTNAVLGGGTTNTFTITDTNPQPTIQFSGTGQSILESVGTISIPATISATPGVWWAANIAIDGASTAVQGTDYTLSSPFYESFEIGATTPDAPYRIITILNRAGYQGTRTIVLTMTSQGVKSTYTVTILDKDPQPVTITNQVSAQTVNFGQPVTFSVAAVGTQPTYQWYRNGTSISGGTNATYSLPTTGLADNGATFSVLVKNAASTVTSATAALTVVSQAPPTVSISTFKNGDVLTPAPVNTQIWVNDWSPGAIVKVAFYANNIKLGETDGSTSNINWNNVVSGTYTLTVQATDNQGQTTTSAPVTITALQPLSFSSWVNNNSLTGAVALDTASPAKDGISNLMKYALGLDPHKALSSATMTDGTNPGMPKVALEGSNLTLLYQKDTTKVDLTYTVETSNDLATWNTTGLSETLQSTNGAIETRKASVLMGTDPKKFIRLKVTH